MPSIDLSQDSNLDANLVKIELNNFVSNNLEEKEDANNDLLLINQTNPDTISSGSSINISNIMVSSSSSCGNYMNVVSSSSSSFGQQDYAMNNEAQNCPSGEGNANGSELSSSSRRSSISGDIETKVLKEESEIIKAPKSTRKPKKMNFSSSKSRKTRRLIRPKRDQDNQDADIDDESDVCEESENECKSNNFNNCLDLDLFDYLIKRNFVKSINQNDIKSLNSTAKQRKLSLYATSSEFVNVNDFEKNLNINKYFYQLIKNQENLKSVDLCTKEVDDTIKFEVNKLMNDLVDQVEMINIVPNVKTNEKSLIKTLLEDISSLNFILSNQESEKKGEIENFLISNEKKREKICLENTQDYLENKEKTSSNPELPAVDENSNILNEISSSNEMDSANRDEQKTALEVEDTSSEAKRDNVKKQNDTTTKNETILFKEDLNILSTQQQQQQENLNSNKVEILEEIENEYVEKNNLNTKKNSCEDLEKNLKVDNDKMTNKVDDEEKTRSMSGESSSSISSNSTYNSDSSANSEANNNIKKVVLKNNEIVLIQDCLDDDDEEQIKILKTKNLNAENLINDSPITVPKREKQEQNMSKSQTFTVQKNPTDDPYVKAALERFDAFCKSKSSHNLDQTGVNPTTPSFVLNRQKSPYLTRKNEDPSIKETVTSFIKRRSARIEPKTDLASRSASETRAEKSSLSSSSLAKKFLGSLTPQLDPLEDDNSSINENENEKIEFEQKQVEPKHVESIEANPKPIVKPKPADLVLENKFSNSSSSSSPNNSPPSSPSKTKVNLIKLEVFNSKTKSKTEEKTTNINKPPIPPTPSVPSISTTRTKIKQVESNKPSETINETKTVNKPTPSNKPTSRIIPIEIKNSKTNSNTSKQISPRQTAKSVERITTNNLNPITSENEIGKNETPIQTSSPSIQDRIRSLSTSFRENKDLNDRNLPLSFSRLREDLTNSCIADNTENIYESAIKENPIRDTRHDPIVEKACSNFMNRLMEFQRLHTSQYQPFTTSPRTQSYSGPIVSARNTEPISPIGLESTPPFKPYYNSSYTPSFTSTYSPSLSNSIYESNYSKPSFPETESSNSRPYVSAIRKRRTVFSDGFDSASTEFRSDNLSDFVTNSANQDFFSHSDRVIEDPKSSIGYSQARNRPLSIVNEENNLSVSGLNRSFTMNDTRLKSSNERESAADILNRSKSSLKKSNSTSGQVKTEPKTRSTVFERLAVNPPVNQTLNINQSSNDSKSSCLTKTNSGSSINAKPSVSYEIKKKEENEIAVVTSVMPKTRRESTNSINSTNSTSNTALNRIRSLDSKSRDKFKSTTNLKTNSKTATNNTTITSNVPACYLYPSTDPKPASILKNSNKSLAVESNDSKRKSQSTFVKSSINEGNKNDSVFERLSKRANSMKNLSNNIVKTKTSSSSSSSSEEADHKVFNDETEDGLFQQASSLVNQSNKTSVFERLYKSNIAAHMNTQEEINKVGLKKNMSVSSANLITGLSGNKKTNSNRQKGFINTRVSLKNKNIDSGNEESNDSKTSDSEGTKVESPRNTTTSESKSISSSFLSKKLMDLFDK